MPDLVILPHASGEYWLCQMLGLMPLRLSIHETLEAAQDARRAEWRKHVH